MARRPGKPPRRGGRGRPPGGPRARRTPRDDRREAEELLIRAQTLLAQGEEDAALATAGEAVRLDRNLLDAYLLIGDVCLLKDDLAEAERVFGGVLRKARKRLPPGRGLSAEPPPEVELFQETLARHGSTLYLMGRLEAAAGAFKELLDTEPPDPRDIEQLLAEVRLQLGDDGGVLELLERRDPAPCETHLVLALAHMSRERWPEAVLRLRQAFLSNLYLLSQLLEEEAPDFGLTHGLDEATPEHAEGIAARLAPWFHLHEDQLDQMAGIAATTPVQAEVEELISTARALNQESDTARRRDLATALQNLRDPQRLFDTTPAVLAELTAEESEGDAADATPTFEV